MNTPAPHAPTAASAASTATPGHANTAEGIAQALMGREYRQLDARAQKVARHVATRRQISRNLAAATAQTLAGAGPAADAPETPSRGQGAADAVARFGGSWTFVGLFAATMLGWVGLNAALLLSRGHTFDPFPYILLNLFLSMLAAIQAPVILMSQNRQAQKDRETAEHDYEVNLKAELEIMLLHQKFDELRQTQWAELLQLQQAQLDLLGQLAQRSPPAPATAA
jgi:uncharacterized membrane protein